MADQPDIYADGVGVGIGPFGLTITLLLTEPSLEAGPHDTPNVVVGRVRMSHALAKALIQNLNDALAQFANVQQTTDTKVKH
jgi:hypothetical protein